MSQAQTGDPQRRQDAEQRRSQPGQKNEPLTGGDETRPMSLDEAAQGEPLPELDEGPRPGPVDEVQQAIFEATRQGLSTEVDVDELPEPLPELDEGPRPGPVDEVQEALFEASREGARTDVDFELLPQPGATRPQKVVKFKPKPSPPPLQPEPAQPELEFEPAAIPLPDFPEPEPAPPLPEFWLQLALFIVFRGLTLFLLKPGGFIRDWSDFDTYFGIAALSDYSLYPFFDFWLEWPPLLPWLAVGAYRLSLLLPPWPDDPRLWFILILGAVFVLFEIGNFGLIYRLARRLFVQPATISRVLWLYAGLFPPIYAMLGFFDGVALFFMLLALELLLADRRFMSAISVAVGFMVKIIPLLLLPVALRRLWHQYRDRPREAAIELGLYAVVFGLTVLVLLAPFLIGGPEWLLASVRSMLGRSSWETVWAVAEGYYGFGAVAGDRLNPAETNFAVHASVLPWWLINLAFAGLYAFLFTRPADYSRPRQVVAFSGMTAALVMLFSKGYSPQFLVYLLPFIVLLFPNGRGLTYALILTGLNLLEQPIYFVLLPASTWLLTFTVVARFGLLALIAVEFGLLLWPLAGRPAWLAVLHQRVPAILAWSSVIAALILLPALGRGYVANRWQSDPVATFAGFMQSWAGQPAPTAAAPRPRLLLSDQATYRQVYPYLQRAFEIELADGAAQYSAAPTVTELLQGLEQVWLLPTGPQAQTLFDVVDGRGRSLASFDFADLGAASLYSFAPNPQPFIAPARFVGGIELLTHQATVEPEAINLTLYWRAVSPQPQSYTVFSQLLNADGQWVAGHDSLPANGASPTDGWPVNLVQADSHRLELPSDLPPGQYNLVVGLYNRFNERLQAIDRNGVGYPNRAVPLATVELR